MKKSFERIQNIMDDNQIKVVSIMKNQVWISKNSGKFEETQIQFNDEEVYYLINFISKDFRNEPNEENPIWRGRIPNGFITDIVIPPVSFDGPVITMYREELFSGNFYSY
ncbi:hypothetical protein [Bacillus cereus group sp. TH152-1LC]|uniref:hypothetical protein n=1 Tax=Bacillus cereus group sp. TH152-1LC TaxID=3018060 RepID=UPI0022E1909C|nr:hypothetical protein [Bacillus cereus group sp. TH152-1LC]MDA1675570.1 hypothetical protein [Bacillus cereus group sp. TH152-1LC]